MAFCAIIRRLQCQRRCTFSTSPKGPKASFANASSSPSSTRNQIITNHYNYPYHAENVCVSPLFSSVVVVVIWLVLRNSVVNDSFMAKRKLDAQWSSGELCTTMVAGSSSCERVAGTEASLAGFLSTVWRTTPTSSCRWAIW